MDGRSTGRKKRRDRGVENELVSINREVKVDEGNKENDQRNDREVNVETE